MYRDKERVHGWWSFLLSRSLRHQWEDGLLPPLTVKDIKRCDSNGNGCILLFSGSKICNIEFYGCSVGVFTPIREMNQFPTHQIWEPDSFSSSRSFTVVQMGDIPISQRLSSSHLLVRGFASKYSIYYGDPLRREAERPLNFPW